MKCVFKHQDLKIFDLKLNNNINSIAVVACCSETYLQVG